MGFFHQIYNFAEKEELARLCSTRVITVLEYNGLLLLVNAFLQYPTPKG